MSLKGNWTHVGPAINLADVQAFEVVEGVQIPEEYVELLIGSYNGGVPQVFNRFSVETLREPSLKLHGVLGINHADSLYSLSFFLEEDPHRLSRRALQIGFDEFNGAIVIKTSMEPLGEVCYRPWDMLDVALDRSLFHIAPGARAFFESLTQARGWEK